MSLTFEGETLNIGGRELTGTVLVDARVTNGSFDHAFGTEHVMDLEFLPAGFVLDVSHPGDLKLDDAKVDRAVQNWMDKHERQLMSRYERACKRAE